MKHGTSPPSQKGSIRHHALPLPPTHLEGEHKKGDENKGEKGKTWGSMNVEDYNLCPANVKDVDIRNRQLCHISPVK